jgi:hypothetical protein
MISTIYETINLYNKERGILPYKYIGSDQHNKSNYFGSNKKLLEDIKKLGTNNFKKNIICEFNNIDNVTLRSMESHLQKCLDVAHNPEYYNKTNSSQKGYLETKEEKAIRMEKLKIKREQWWNNLSIEEKILINKKSGERFKKYNLSTKGRTYEEIFGEEKAKNKKIKHSRGNNGMSKKLMSIEKNIVFECIKDAINFYGFNEYKKPYRKIQEKIKSGDLIYI